MVIVSVAAWLMAPAPLADAVTEAILVPTGVPVFPPLVPELLQETSPDATRMNARNATRLNPGGICLRRAPMPNSNAKTGKANAYARWREDGAGDCKAALAPVVDTVRVLVAGAPFGETEVGLKLQAAPEGSPLQAKLTFELNPFSGVTVNVACPLCPATIVRVVGLTETVKSGAGALMV